MSSIGCKLSLFVVLIISASFVYSQGFVQVTGCTLFYDYPVEGVNIAIDGQPAFAKTDSKGFFSVQIPNKPLTLVFSHVSGKTKKVKITASMLRKQNAENILNLGNIEIELKINELETVQVVSSRIEKAYNKPEAWILDYEIVNGNLALLLLEDKKRLIRAVNLKDSTLFEIRTKKKYRSLYKDFAGNLHALASDSIFQLFPDFSDCYAYPISRYHEQLKHCVINTDNSMYLQLFGDFNQQVNYFKVDKKSGKRTVLATAFDEQQAIYNQGFLYYEILGKKPKTSYSKGFIFDPDQIDELLDANRSWKIQYFSKILCRPTYQPLKRIGDNLYLFNHLENKIIRFDLDGNELAEIPANYAKVDKSWANEIIVNEEETRCFAKFINTGIVTLKEIDLETGRIKNTFKIEQHIFPEKIRIQNNEVYYLYRDYKKQDRNERCYLWKQKME